jgi:hypothetical protein
MRITLRHVDCYMVDRRRSANWKGRNVTSLQAISTATGLEAERPMKSPVVKRSIVIAGHKTSVSLEDAFWKGPQGNRRRARHDAVGHRCEYRLATAARQSVVRNQAVRTRSLSRAIARQGYAPLDAGFILRHSGLSGTPGPGGHRGMTTSPAAGFTFSILDASVTPRHRTNSRT